MTAWRGNRRRSGPGRPCISSFLGEGGDQFLLATTYLQPEPAAADLQPDGARIAAADGLACQQNARFPQDLAQGEIIPFADVEDRFGVHDRGSSGRVRYQRSEERRVGEEGRSWWARHH